MRVALGIDHAGVALLDVVTRALHEGGCTVDDLGQFDDYPDAALAVARKVAASDAPRGVVICGSGAGVTVAANKVHGIRAATGHDHYTAAQCVTHDNCNVLCLGARVVGTAIARECTLAFVRAQFSGEERHERRLRKVNIIESTGLEAPL